LLSGATGHTYSHDVVFKFSSGWENQLDDFRAKQISIAKKIFEKYQWWTLVPDQSLITSGAGGTLKEKRATLSSTGNFLFVYYPERTSASTDFDRFPERDMSKRHGIEQLTTPHQMPVHSHEAHRHSHLHRRLAGKMLFL